jgi:hypothetical protein
MADEEEVLDDVEVEVEAEPEDLDAEDLDEDDLEGAIVEDDLAGDELAPDEVLTDGAAVVEEEDEDTDAAAERPTRAAAAPAGDDDEDQPDPDDVEADLDTILKDRIAANDDEEEDEEEEKPGRVKKPGTEDDGTGENRVAPRKAGEFVCSSCFLVKPNMQLADAKKKLCADCV